MIEIQANDTMIKLPNFDREDFECKCGCGLNNMKDRFLWKLQFARTEARIPFIVNSGCRCKQHNKDEGGSDNSDHLTGEGSDIQCLNSWDRWTITSAAMSAGFKRIGIGKTFIHLGDRWDNPQKKIWLY